MKNILFLVTGMTPQIITETVWALACDPDNDNPWVPDEIHVLSTDDGLTQIRSRLFDDGVFVAMQAEYPQLATIRFSDEFLHAICQDGIPVKDLKTPHDNELAADLICQKVREFTSCDDVVLHVSIAGGRKTMGFYAGYALSLYGRACDSMSHVLVDSEFETAKGFYYPTTYDKYVEQNHTQKRLNAKDAKIWLAQIPFVRLRASLSNHDIVASKSFSQVIETLNLSLKPLQITLDTHNKCVIIGNKICELTPKEFSIYLLCAKLLAQGEMLHYPSKEFADDIGKEHQQLFNQIYGRYKAKDDIIVDNLYLSTALSTMKRKLVKEFGLDIYKKMSIQSKGNGYGIVLSPQQIVIN